MSPSEVIKDEITKILIIKLGAMGDVLRTTPLLPALKRKYPKSEISWLVDRHCREILEGVPFLDHLYLNDADAITILKGKRFDLSICLDKEDEAIQAVMAIPAEKRTGFGKDSFGNLIPLDKRSEYAVRLGTDDELKFRKNQKTYQEISFEQIGLKFEKEEYFLNISDADRAYAQSLYDDLGIDLSSNLPIVGFNTGSGSRFAGKKLPLEAYIYMAERLAADGGCRVVLLGGPKEKERNTMIEKSVVEKIYNTGCHYTIKQFAAIVSHCDLVVTGDTLAMHIAIAMKREVVAFFASTCAAEIELYGRGTKLISDLECAPCYLRSCPIDEKCMKVFPVDRIIEKVQVHQRRDQQSH